MVKVRATVAVYLLMSLAAVGCSDDGQAANPSTTSSAPPASTPSASATPSEETWRAKFTDAQLEAYEQALGRWQEYTEKTNAIYKAGRNTPAAREVFREFSMQWQGRVGELVTRYERDGARVVRPPEGLSWQAVSARPRVVVIRQCTDYRDLLVTVKGKKLAGTQPDHLVTPLLIEMDRPIGKDWMVADTKLKDSRSCTA